MESSMFSVPRARNRTDIHWKHPVKSGYHGSVIKSACGNILVIKHLKTSIPQNRMQSARREGAIL